MGYFLFSVLFLVGLSFVFTLISVFFSSREENKNGSSSFMEKFTRILIVLIIIMVIGFLSEKCGCSSEDEPDYPMKYQPD
ncbi:hypothetical protein [Flavobacterium sp.]|uniref:hypothetical protein n=1 Tax=Flavobacterium sp. TaxID=239 RepID=UPI002621C470|nr:hypothetical protein [Flavobacterium sp.]